MEYWNWKTASRVWHLQTQSLSDINRWSVRVLSSAVCMYQAAERLLRQISGEWQAVLRRSKAYGRLTLANVSATILLQPTLPKLGSHHLFWFKMRTKSSNRPKSDHEGVATEEHQTNSLWDVGRFVLRALWDLRVWLILGALAVPLIIQILKWFEPRGPVNNFSSPLNMIAVMWAGWPALIPLAMDAIQGLWSWWSTDPKNISTSIIPQARFISPISAEEAFVIPEYLTTLKSSITQSNVMDRNFRLSPTMEDSFRRAMEQAELLKGIHDGLITDVKLRFAGHYDQLGQLHVDIERAIIEIGDRNETKTSYFGGLFTTDRPYARARNHGEILRSITDEMFEASDSEMKDLAKYLKKLGVFETKEERHGAICGLRSRTLKSIKRWTKGTKDMRSGVRVMCNSSKRSTVKLCMMRDALREVCMTQCCHL